MSESSGRHRGRRPLPYSFVTAAVVAAFPLGAGPAPAAASEKLEIRPGDHVCIIGNTLADRMQHDGWLEAYLQGRFARHQLVVRNLGFSADELTVRLRSMDFGTPDQWLAGVQPVPQPGRLGAHDVVRDNRLELTQTRADVIFAFFGYNESFGDRAGLEKFKKDLDGFIKHTLARKYNGKSAPRLVIFSPSAHEERSEPNWPDGRENNRRLELYTAAMREVAQADGVAFVDLFGPTRELYRRASRPLTINGIHFNAEGNEALARIIDASLFGAAGPKRDRVALEKLRQAVVDKNFYWFNRYRTVDGYNVYGGRAFEQYNGQTNYVCMQREMEILDVMTANRDKRIWAVAQGGDLAVDDGNTPEFIPTTTNKPGPLPGGKHVFLGGEEAIQKMTVAPGLKVTLFASEKEFPELAKPVQMQFDARGRLWVAVWPSYPHWKPKEEMNDKILILEDTDGDGKADKCTVFADHLHCPTGFEFYNGGVIVAQAPDLMFFKDTKGDGKADVRQRILHGLDSADTHHTANSFALDPGGALYFQEGTFHHTQVETPYGPAVRCVNAGVYRYEPRSQKFDAYITYGFANPHGHVWDRWGQDIVYDGTGANPYHGALFSGHLDYPHKHQHPPQVYQQRTRPCPGAEILSSRHFPEANQGNLLVANVIGFQGILQYKLEDRGSSLAGTEVEPVLYSSDPNFRPSDLKIGPDGAIWFIDWHNPIIGHLQHHLRDPNRDRTHGRIYRVTCEGRPLLKPVAIAGEPVERLLELLKEPEDRVRYRARIELGGRPTAEVIAAVRKWEEVLDSTDPNYEHHRLEALWVHQYHNVVDVDLLMRVLASRDFRARAAATRVLCYWRDRVPDAFELLQKLAADSHPRARLEAVRAASFFTGPEAVQVVLASASQPGDVYLDYTRGETMRALEPLWRNADALARLLGKASPAGARLLAASLSTADLLKIKDNEAVYRELLVRPGLRDEDRKRVALELAGREGTSEVRVLLDALEGGANDASASDIVRLLTDRGPAGLAALRGELERVALRGGRPVLRQLGFVALVAADGAADKAWALAGRSAAALLDLTSAVPFVRDPAVRASLYPKVEPLLHGFPNGITASAEQARAIRRAAMEAAVSVRGQELQAFKALAPFVRKGPDRGEAVRAILRIPAAYWPAEDARPLVDAILDHVRRLPADVKASPAARDALQLAEGLAGLLPPEEARQARRQIGELGVRVVRVGTVPEQMIYDKDKLAVQAGRPVQFVVENHDLMPHNFVVTRPGALEEVGTLAEATATQPGALERNYVPPSDKILLASRLLQPREKQEIAFTAPTRPGVYPYVCTYPGHWRRMYGALYVVEDLDDYLANPDDYVAKHALPVSDELLKFIRPRKEWKLEELAGVVEQMDRGRSFANGKHLFQVANCVACHKMNGVGQEFGPDLAKLEPRPKAVDVLRDVLDPSAKINEKYYAYVVETQDGKTLTGLVVGETADEVKVVENPLAKTEPVVVKKADILERKKSPISIMPKGLLDKLTREEILDLIAYVVSRGEAGHALFQGEHEHGHSAGH